jgi:FtsP/CotA-like multicopper oxidase with cupredoxin domain
VPSRVVTPDVPLMPWQMVGGVKEFRLVAEPVKTEFLPGRHVDAWGFNGHMPGPTIEITEGDRVRFLVHNKLPEPFSMHWHGLEVPIEMDGGPGISQAPIAPGGTFTYEFTVHQHGTFFYHSHMAMQELMGMVGFFIAHRACRRLRAWIAISVSSGKGGRSCRTTPSRTRWRWSSTGSR